MSLTMSRPIAATITSLSLTVYDAAASCDGSLARNGSPLPDLSGIPLELGIPKSIAVSPGRRTFYVLALEGSRPVARGCTTVDLGPGERTSVAISVEEIPPDEADAGVPPPNDDCEGAVALPEGNPLLGQSLAHATDDVAPACGVTGEGDVVFSFTIPDGPNARARVTVSNADGFDPVLVAHQGGCPGVALDCAQASTGAAETLDLPNLVPGTYYVWVEAAAGQAGAGTFDILYERLPPVPPPGNDQCGGATTLAEATPVTGSTLGAAEDYAPSCLVADDRDAVHTIDLGATARAVLVTIAPTGGGWSPAAALYPHAMCGIVDDELACVPYADGQGLTRLNRPNLGAGMYDVVIDGTAGARGDYEIRYETRPADTSFGYWMIETTGTYTPLVDFVDTGFDTTGTVNSESDEGNRVIPLPFAFPFFGNTYTEVYAHANMFLSFTPPPTGSEGYVNDCPLDDTAPMDAIALFWDDGIATPGAKLLYKVEGQAPNRRVVVEYRDWDVLHQQGLNVYRLAIKSNQQVILYENGDIELRYGPRQPPNQDRGCGTQHLGCSASIGIEGRVGGIVQHKSHLRRHGDLLRLPAVTMRQKPSSALLVTFMTLGSLWFVLQAEPLAHAQTGNAPLDAAIALYQDLEYEKAVIALSAAVSQPGLSRQELTEGYKYLALSYVALGRDAEAKEAFRKLLEANASYRLPRTESPRALDLFDEVARSMPDLSPVELSQTASPVSPRKGMPVTVAIAIVDGRGRTDRIVVYYRTRGQKTFSMTRGLRGGAGRFNATIPGTFVNPPSLEYYVVALDRAGRVLAAEGTAASPLQLAVSAGLEEKPIYAKWWFWGGVGAVVAAGVAAGVALSNDGGGPTGGDAIVDVTVTAP